MVRRPRADSWILGAGIAFLTTVSLNGCSPGSESSTPTSSPTPESSEDAVALQSAANAVTDTRELQGIPVEPHSDSESDLDDDVGGQPVVVVVLDSEGQPLAGALVEIVDEAPLGSWRTGEDGRCPLPVVIGDEGLHLRVSAEGYVTDCAWKERDDPLQFGLHRSVRVTGRVVSADLREPVVGAQIEVFSMTGCASDEPDAVTDATGRFELPSLPTGDFVSWTITADGFFRLEQDLNLLEDRLDVELGLERGFPLAFEVFDAQTGVPIHSAKVTSGGHSGVETDALGRAEAVDLVPWTAEEAQLWVKKEGYCELTAIVRPGELAPHALLRLPLLRGARLEGTVCNESGSTERDVELSLCVDGRIRHEESTSKLVALPDGWSMEGDRVSRSQSGPGGTFAFEGLQPGQQDYRIAAIIDGRVQTGWLPVPALGPPGSTTLMKVVLAPPATGVVTGTLALNGSRTTGRVKWCGPTQQGVADVGVDGSFRLESIEAGKIQFTPWPERLACEDGFARTWEVEVTPDNEAHIDIDLVLELSAISGRVVDRNGAPQAGRTVNGRAPQSCWAEAEPTGPDGAFVLQVPARAGLYELRVGEFPDSVELEGVSADAKDIELVLPGKGALRLRVLDRATRSALTDYVWFLENELGESFRGYELTEEGLYPDPQGWYEQDLRPGSWKLLVGDGWPEVSGYLPVDGGTVRIPADGSTMIVELERQRALELVVKLAADQEPFPDDVFVVLLEADRAGQVQRVSDYLEAGPAFDGINVAESRRVLADSQGLAHVASLWGGPCRFVAFPETIVIEPAEVVVTGKETEPLEIRWKPR
jgi:hypothetical protein